MAKASAKKKTVVKKKSAAPVKKSAAATKKAQQPKPKNTAVAKKAAAKKSAKKDTKKKKQIPAKSTAKKPAAKKAGKVVTKKSAAPAAKKSAKKPVAKKSTGGAKSTKSTGNGNKDIVQMIATLAAYSMKAGENHKSNAYKKSALALKKFVDAGNNISSGSVVAHLANVGKVTVAKIDDFIKTGKVKKLEEFKNTYGDLNSNLIAAMGGYPAAGDAAVAGTSAKSKAKSAAPAKSAAGKSNVFDVATMAKIRDEEENLANKSNDQLKALARLNGQKVTGTKGELVDRLANQVVLGAIKLCGSCGGGKLKFNVASGRYVCPGFYDDTEYVQCGVTFSHSTDGADLRQPWVTA